MGKDPAVLFYTSDFLTGTELFSFEDKGKYIHLLCTQHQSGHLPEFYMKKILGDNGSPVWSKFKKDEAGFYYQSRMEEEAIKRKNFSESRRNNIKKRYETTHESTYVPTSVDTSVTRMKVHMENENENRNKDINNKKDRVLEYFSNKGYPKDEAESFYNHYESQGWVTGSGMPITNWRLKAENWHKGQIERNYKTQKKDKLTHKELLALCKGLTPDETRDVFAKYKFNAMEKIYEFA